MGLSITRCADACSYQAVVVLEFLYDMISYGGSDSRSPPFSGTTSTCFMRCMRQTYNQEWCNGNSAAAGEYSRTDFKKGRYGSPLARILPLVPTWRGEWWNVGSASGNCFDVFGHLPYSDQSQDLIIFLAHCSIDSQYSSYRPSPRSHCFPICRRDTT